VFHDRILSDGTLSNWNLEEKKQFRFHHYTMFLKKIKPEISVFGKNPVVFYVFRGGSAAVSTAP